MKNYQPIGIFDSGVGGLAVAHAIKKLLPHESIYYIGDTARLPYGEQSREQLQCYTRAIGNWLLDKNCKIILIACNTATAAAADQLQAQVGRHIPVLNVIDPVVEHIKQKYIGSRIGIIATNYTIQSQIYLRKLQSLQVDVELKALSTPSLVPMVESNRYEAHIVMQYLSNPHLANIQALILGCTHYYFIKNLIAQYYQANVSLIDGSYLLAKSLQKILQEFNLMNSVHNKPKDLFMATKLTEQFQVITKRLFGETPSLISLPKVDHL